MRIVMSNPSPNPSHSIQVRYEDFTARYANHALVNVGAEEVYLDFTSGIVPDRPGTSLMPIHTRIAMTPAGVVRLAQLLAQTVQNFQVVQVPQGGGSQPPAAPVPVEIPAGEPV
ncbi:MAG: hypothetical protein JWL90_1488 [Chthoniobacteraceae bacterium]|nr:hypothetical protein [Chthoniobacteraceae bacterium]